MDGRYVLVGLGNPGREFKRQRHNVGFMLLDHLAEEHGLAFGGVRRRALTANGRIAGEPVMLAKPQTFMNLSGHAVSQLLRYYRVPLDRLLVIFDDLDLPLGALRFRESGGTGGHKGMGSIVEQLGSKAFARLRVGIGRPPGRMDPADYVLQPFGAQEQSLLSVVLAEAAAGILTFLTDGITAAISHHNRVLGGDE
jgi:PTH1 family peptidyl-tRNA hydrolase